MDFFQIKEKHRNGIIEIYPDFKVCRSKDLMVRGKAFYAIWDEEKNLWSTDEYDVQRLVDKALLEYAQEKKYPYSSIKFMSEFSSKAWTEFRSYMSHISDNSHQLDERLTFANDEVKKKDYISKRLPYSLEEGSHDAYDEIATTLYESEELTKLEWAIGAIVSGDARDIQKFLVLYGEAGTGKSTILNIIQQLFVGYYTAFEAKALTSSNNSFSTEVFKSNPLVAIQHDGDLSKIEDNTKLNSIISHEEMTMNEKYKPSYTARVNCFLFMGTNKPVKITDAKSGIIRRLIDVKPTGNKIPTSKYFTLVSQIDFELGAIAHHCLEVYRKLGKNYYAGYRPIDMMMQTDTFFNFVEAQYFLFSEQDGISLSQAYDIYKDYCNEALVDFKLPRHKFREELKNYFSLFLDVTRIDGKQIRSYYTGFIKDKFNSKSIKEIIEHAPAINFDNITSIFDEQCYDCLAQYASDNETPTMKWDKVETKLSDLDSSKLHYVRLPENHVVIDFDIKDTKGNKSLNLNMEEASKFPSTYAELSKSGNGIHLHYIYDGDVRTLSHIYKEGVEVKTFIGNSSLRRKLSKCNNIPIKKINSGLPLKGVDKMVNFEAVKNEKVLRSMILKNLNKEVHPGTKPSIDFINKILEDAYKSGLNYDVTDLRPKILAFANNSSHQADYCIKLVSQMKFCSDEPSEPGSKYDSEELAFFDVEVYPNLFIVCWKFKGSSKCVKMINPKPQDIELLMRLKLVGFNCRRYDNHILYACYIGYTNYQLFELSQRIINESRNCMFGEAYNLSYTDVYDFSTEKQSLKKFEVQLGIPHKEMDLPWDQPVPEELWDKVAEYCCNDVNATEATFDDRREDFIARLILSKLSGLTPNDTTQMHTARIVFGDDKRPQDKFIYTDLSEMFPGYTFENGKSMYRGEEVGEGGYVYAEPGMYSNAALLDVASMHPRSAIELNHFGPYTKNFEELVDGRLAVKHADEKAIKTLLGGILHQVLEENPDISLDSLAYALKIAINIVYGLTSAKFDNKFKDPRNKDNIVAKRGALFMIDLKHAVQEKGYTVAHIKTDSIKIPDATPEIIEFVFEFGKKYGYTFEHEATYEKMCLVNDAVYIAKYGWATKEKLRGKWSATGAQFAHPYVFKTLFSDEIIEFEDVCETKSVTTALYLDMNERLGENEHAYQFIGKVGKFCPIRPKCGGGLLMREKDGKYYAATGSKGYRWLESDTVKVLNKEYDIDFRYFNSLVDDAVDNISKFGDISWFREYKIISVQLPWEPPCGDKKFQSCYDCPNLHDDEYHFDCHLGYDIAQIIRKDDNCGKK